MNVTPGDFVRITLVGKVLSAIDGQRDGPYAGVDVYVPKLDWVKYPHGGQRGWRSSFAWLRPDQLERIELDELPEGRQRDVLLRQLTRRLCAWQKCSKRFEAHGRGAYCSNACRQAAYRWRKETQTRSTR